VADRDWDASDIPLDDGSVDEIKAEHVIEHFDWIHLRYIFFEWGRILREGGILDIETPEAKRSLRRLARSHSTDDLQWTFGIGSPGQAHGGLYDKRYLERELEMVGFGKFSYPDPVTYPGKPVLRIKAVRKKKGKYDNALASFRKQVKKHYNDESYMLIPAEENIADLSGSVTSEDKKALRSNLIRTALRDPSLSLMMSRTLSERGLYKDAKLGGLLKSLKKEKIHQKMFSLWIKREKGPEGIPQGLDSMIRAFESRISISLTEGRDLSDELDHFRSLTPTPIAILSPILVAERAREFANKGIRVFAEGKMEEAKTLFERSSGAAPGYLLPLWNLARVMTVLKDPSSGPTYEKAILFSNGKLRDAIRAEFSSRKVHRTPVDANVLASFQ
jgi:hypothetical protein